MILENQFERGNHENYIKLGDGGVSWWGLCLDENYRKNSKFFHEILYEGSAVE